jgi:hypothetical protein
MRRRVDAEGETADDFYAPCGQITTEAPRHIPEIRRRIGNLPQPGLIAAVVNADKLASEIGRS